MGLKLDGHSMNQLRRILNDLINKTEADGCLLCDGGGHALIQVGRGTKDPMLLAALGAGVFAGSRELARILGENEFSAVFHQGNRKSIFIRAVDSDVLLVVIFSRQESVGLVKLYALPAAGRLRAIFNDIYELGEEVSDDPDKSFVLSEEGSFFSRE